MTIRKRNTQHNDTQYDNQKTQRGFRLVSFMLNAIYAEYCTF
jgi:hypothetical protein